MTAISTGDKQTYVLLQGTKRVSHAIDDDDENVLDQPALFSRASSAVSGNINVVLWDEELTDVAVMDAELAESRNVLIKKIYATDSDLTASDIVLLR